MLAHERTRAPSHAVREHSQHTRPRARCAQPPTGDRAYPTGHVAAPTLVNSHDALLYPKSPYSLDMRCDTVYDVRMVKQATENDAMVSYRLPSMQLRALKRMARERHLDVADILREMTREWFERTERVKAKGNPMHVDEVAR